MKNTFFILVMLLPISLYASLPQGAIIEHGSVSMQKNDTSLEITQYSDKAILGWDSFNLSEGNLLHIIQPSHDSIMLNRIQGGPSTIAGMIKANGQVFLINPAGLVFTKSSIIDVHGLVATTANIANENFLQGNWIFRQDPEFSNSEVIFEGSVVTAERGYVVLACAQVSHRGYIVAKQGRVQLGAGTAFTLDLYGDGLINFSASEDIHKLEVTGTIDVSENPVLLSPNQARQVSSQAVNLSGDVVATSVSKQGGTIVFGGGHVKLNNKAYAKGETGGKIIVAGKQIALSENAQLDVSGTYKAGEISIGNIRSHIIGLPESEYTQVLSGAELIAASSLGDAGKVVVWSKAKTDFAGYIDASSQNGDGGFVEVSGLDLWFRGNVNTSSVYGKNGMLLFDPAIVNIVGSPDADNTNDPNILGDELDGSSSFSDDQIQTLLGSNNITIQADSEIIFNVPLFTTSEKRLTLKAPTVRVNNFDISVRDLYFDATNVYGLGSLGTNALLTEMTVSGKGMNATTIHPYGTAGAALSSANHNLSLIVKDLKVDGKVDEQNSKVAIWLYNMKRFELENAIVANGAHATLGGGLYHNANAGTKVAEIVIRNSQFIGNTNPISIGQVSSIRFEDSVIFGAGNSGYIRFNSDVNSVSGAISLILPTSESFTIESLAGVQLPWNNYSGTTINVAGNANADLIVKNIHFNGTVAVIDKKTNTSTLVKANELLKIDTVRNLTLDNVKLEGGAKGLEVTTITNNLNLLNNVKITDPAYGLHAGLTIFNLGGQYAYNGSNIFEFTGGSGQVEQNILDVSIGLSKITLTSAGNSVNILATLPSYINHLKVDVPTVTGDLNFAGLMGHWLTLEGSSAKTELVNPNINLGDFSNVTFNSLKFDGANKTETGLSFSADKLNNIFLLNSIVENSNKGLNINNIKTGANITINNSTFTNNNDVMEAASSSNIGIINFENSNVDNSNSGKITFSGQLTDFNITNSSIAVPVHFYRPNGYAVEFGGSTIEDQDSNHYSLNKLNKWLGYNVDLEFSIKYSLFIKEDLSSDSTNKLTFNVHQFTANKPLNLQNADLEINKPTTFILNQGDIDTLNLWGATEGIIYFNGKLVNSKNLNLNVNVVNDLSNIGAGSAQMVVTGKPLVNGLPQTTVKRFNYTALGSDINDANANLTLKNLKIISNTGSSGNVNHKKLGVFNELKNLVLTDVVFDGGVDGGLQVNKLHGDLSLSNVTINNTANPLKITEANALLLNNVKIPTTGNTGILDFGKAGNFDIRPNNEIGLPITVTELSGTLKNDSDQILTFANGAGKLELSQYGSNNIGELTLTSTNLITLLGYNFEKLPHIKKVKFLADNVSGDLKVNVGSSGIVIEGNTNTKFDGGSLLITGALDKNITIKDLIIDKKNTGSAIVIDKANNLEVSNITIENAKSNNNGSGISFAEVAGSFKVLNSTFIDNSSVQGGAIWGGKVTGEVAVKDSTFKNNVATDLGGAVAILDGNVVNTTGSSFYDNTAKFGGAIYSKPSLSLDNTIFFGNKSNDALAVKSLGSLKLGQASVSPNLRPIDLLFTNPKVNFTRNSSMIFKRFVDFGEVSNWRSQISVVTNNNVRLELMPNLNIDSELER